MIRVTRAALAAALSVAAVLASAAPPQSLELFGVKLKGATRDQLRQAFKSGGLQPTRVDSKYWIDKYDPASVLEGASEFAAGYVGKTNTFAYAEYTFNGFMDPGLVTKVAKMVTSKYGPPSAHEGMDNLGNVTYRWNLPQGMVIMVTRGWPDTTTYLDFKDVAAFVALKAEVQAQNDQDDQAKAKSQSTAF
jgi:hypothetical protein